jgi:probable phosphoglycerate mutase
MLYIIRHGITDWNKNQKLQGRTDVPLNDEGRRMAEEAALKYKEVHFDICYCSPLLRAKETAEILLNGRDIPIITDDRLKEMAFGIYEGTENYRSTYMTGLSDFFNDPAEYKDIPEDAESVEDLFFRTGEFLDEIIYPLLDKGRDILIVGHGAMNSSIICQVRHLPLSDFWSSGIENCKLMQLI